MRNIVVPFLIFLSHMLCACCIFAVGPVAGKSSWTGSDLILSLGIVKQDGLCM